MRALRLFLAVCAAWLIASSANAAITMVDLGHVDGWPVAGGGGFTTSIASITVASGDIIICTMYEGAPSGGTPFPTCSDPAGDAFHYINCQATSNGAFDGQTTVGWAISSGLSSQTVTQTFGNSGEFVKVGLRKITGGTFFGADKSICGQTAVNTTTVASGALTPTATGEAVYGTAISKFTAGAWTQAGGFGSAGAWGTNNVNDPVDGFQVGSTTPINYNPVANSAPNGGASILLIFNSTPPPFNRLGAGLLGVGPTVFSQFDNECAGAPIQAAAAGYCMQTFRMQPSEFTTTEVDTGLTFASGYRLYFDDCHGQTPATGLANTTLGTGGNNIIYGDNSGGFGANLSTGTCAPASTSAPGKMVGTFFGGGGYFSATIDFTAASTPGDWQAIWLWDIECSTNPVQDTCNWKNQQTKQAITSATYVSATGVLSVTAPATTLTQFGSAQLTDLTGTGAFASLENTACYIPNAVSAATSYTLNCKSGLGTLTLTGGNAGNAFFHFSEFDIFEMFMGNFGNPLTAWQQTLHEWQKPASALNQYQTEVYSPAGGQASFSSPHEYGLLWVPATASMQGSACAYYDGVLQQCQTWSQFINNGTQAQPARYTVAGAGNTYVSATGVITLTLSATASFGVGTTNVHLDNSSGSSGMPSQLVGNWTSLAGTTGTTLVLQGPVGQGVLSITGGEAAQPWANGIADLMHFVFYNGCNNTNKCTMTNMQVWQKDTSQNLVF